ncbi:hypothetical protein KDA_62690 [Dictyobacter alpinus]|uniref:Uncharacterized protein n=1 Tax=Dictyobacter alpinus TaxID=2014873 RepID=A0A402BHE1_9CHLR|nr:hypothetical protein [Dictyobacter alpinus]GCE30785.1 hypothetical protein KDA_62690 [Dictyobacter alpinus]
MSDWQPQVTRKETFINIRKLAALDMVLHGPRFVLIEFGLAVIFCAGFGVFSLVSFFQNPNHPLFTLLIGVMLAWIALNYVTLLLYSIVIARHQESRQEVAVELENKEIDARRYTFQSMWLLLLPLFVPILALMQESQRSH